MSFEMDTKTYMCELLKGVIALYPDPASYGRSCRNRLARAGLSEMEILRQFAYHGEENCIEPQKLVKDARDFIEDFSRNQFVLKTDNRWSFLPKSLGEFQKTKFDDTHFICTSCFTMFPMSEKYGKTSRCSECDKVEQKKYIERKQDKKKNKPDSDDNDTHVKGFLKHQGNSDAKQPESVQENVIDTELETTNQEPIKHVSEVVEVVKPHPMSEVLESLKRAITIEEFTGGRESALLTIGVKTKDLSKFLEFLDPIINHPETETDTDTINTK